MFTQTRVRIAMWLTALVLALSPVLSAQDAADDGSSRNQLILGGAVVVLGVLYFMRRKKRKSLE